MKIQPQRSGEALCHWPVVAIRDRKQRRTTREQKSATVVIQREHNKRQTETDRDALREEREERRREREKRE